MADESDDPDAAANRLEAALERIASRAAQPRPARPAAGTPPELAERLDKLILRLKTALGRAD